ncbi:MAG: MFS transporter [Planctomycetes bacterium]|nr:MFS transporter [Planctomycetota bacterium]
MKTKLSVMMFLQYAIWGAWLPLLWPFLNGHRGFTGTEIGHMFAVGAVGAIVAPFIAGQIADRYFNTEKFLGLSHLIGAGLVWFLATTETYSGFLWLSLAYSLVYSPTLPLTNSLAFHHLEDRDRDFGRVRVWGTVGWIVAGILIGQFLYHFHTPTEAAFSEAVAQNLTSATDFKGFTDAAYQAGMGNAFKLSAILGVVMGLYCLLVLPKTPPTKGKEANATMEALKEVRRQPLLTLFLLAVPVSCIHQFYFVHTSGFLGTVQSSATEAINKVFGVGGGGLMTIGQISEVAVLAAIPLVAKDWSRKTLLAIGLLAYAGRMALFAHAADSVPLVMLGLALHGLCFGCFIFVAFMIVDEETTKDVRASAQSLFNLVIIGIGIIVGSMIAGDIAERYMVDNKVTDYTGLFSWPMWAALACFVLLMLFYPNGRKPAPQSSTP